MPSLFFFFEIQIAVARAVVIVYITRIILCWYLNKILNNFLLFYCCCWCCYFCCSFNLSIYCCLTWTGGGVGGGLKHCSRNAVYSTNAIDIAIKAYIKMFNSGWRKRFFRSHSRTSSSDNKSPTISIFKIIFTFKTIIFSKCFFSSKFKMKSKEKNQFEFDSN